MIFSSLLFLYLFLPIVLIAALCLGRRWQNALLLVASLVFYAWGGVSYTVLLLISIALNYTIGRGIDHYRGSPRAKQVMILGIVLNLLMLCIFKYTNFLVDNLNVLLAGVNVMPVEMRPIRLPIGISFFTFQAMSYIIDVYQGRANVEKRITNVGLYIALFPQLIAGPIVRYREIATQIIDRRKSWEKFSYGIERFVWGLAKKVLLANNFAILADDIFVLQASELDPLTAWIGVVFYTMQLYFDFSGYSDMAVGLGSMFGFKIPENFNFPYISRSIRELWRRWHITLSQWFRDYVYIPMGGSRMSARRTYINLLAIFVLVGFWHGAAWTYVVFGLLQGLFMIIERRGFEKWLMRQWRPVSHIYTLVAWMISLVIFRTQNLQDSFDYLKAMLGLQTQTDFRFDHNVYFGVELSVLTLIGILACTPVFRTGGQRITKYLLDKSTWQKQLYALVTVAATIAVFLYASINLAMGTYNPFIYYQF